VHSGASIDDPCIREHQVDEADMHEIIRHLVDEVWRILSMNRGVVDVGVSQFLIVLRSEFGQDIRVIRFI
jgi:hypothetical protein